MPSALATRVTTAALLLVAVLAALFLLPPAGWGVVVLLAITACAREWAHLIGLAGGKAIAVVAVVFALGLCAGGCTWVVMCRKRSA